MPEMLVDLPGHSYPLIIEPGLLARLGSKIKKIYHNQKIAVITDENVFRLYGAKMLATLRENGFQAEAVVISPGERSKSLEVLNMVYNGLLDAGITREDLVIAFGGGVVGDLGGFAAATFLRGVPLVQMPTSLLAQIDSSIGGKVAVDLPRGKNLVGTFYHPQAVYIDPDLLQTLEDRFFKDGMGEVIKYACIRNRDLFDYLAVSSGIREKMGMEKIISLCCRIKKDIVERDERDRGERMLLNFGHTLGHALEKYFGFEKYTHGEAVAIGMNIFTINSESLGMTETGTAARLKELLDKFGLPFRMPDVDPKVLAETIGLDKKSFGRGLRIILLESVGQGKIYQISHEEIYKFIKN